MGLKLETADPRIPDIEGADATDLLNRWNQDGHFNCYTPQEFRERLMAWYGDRVAPDLSTSTASDEEILDAVVRGMGPSTRLVRTDTAK